jgi:uncharacterized membrane protein YoaK (UPF0700 family)
VASVDPHPGYRPARGGRPPIRFAARTLVPTRIRDLLLVALAVCSGAVDAISYLALGKVFSAFMTGNIVFLGLALTRAGGPNLLHVCVALATFALGVAAAVKIVKPTKGTALWPRRVSVALGLSALAWAGFLAGWIATSGRPSSAVGHVLIGLSALAMGVQSGAVLSLAIPGVFTTAATATVVDLASDLAGWPQAPNERGRLAGVLAGLCVGAAAGALMVAHARSYAPVIPLIGTLVVITIASRALKPGAERPRAHPRVPQKRAEP